MKKKDICLIIGVNFNAEYYSFSFSLLYRCTRNTTISTSTSNFGSIGRVDGPLLVNMPSTVTHSLLTCHQTRGSQVLSTQRCCPPTTARPKVYLYK